MSDVGWAVSCPRARVLVGVGRLAVALASSALCGACDVDFERMRDQPRFDPYEPSRYFANGTIMQHPPEGVVDRQRVLGPEELVEGTSAGVVVSRVPLQVDAELLSRGRNRYDIFCAPCHGVVGDSDTEVSENMRLRPPPALIDAPLTGYPAGRIYRVIVAGYGLMRSYRHELDVRDRWAVVAYVQALQLSQNARLAALPEEIREQAMRQLRVSSASERKSQ